MLHNYNIYRSTGSLHLNTLHISVFLFIMYVMRCCICVWQRLNHGDLHRKFGASPKLMKEEFVATIRVNLDPGYLLVK